MGGARHPGTARPRIRAAATALGGGTLIPWRLAGASVVILSAVGVGACDALDPDFSEVVQITVLVPDSVLLADTLRAHATTATARGDTVPATFVWVSFDTTILALADSSAGLFVGRRVGTTGIQTRAGNLRSNPISIRVTELTVP